MFQKNTHSEAVARSLKMKKWLIRGAIGIAVLSIGALMFLRSQGMFASGKVYVRDGVAIGGYDAVAYFVESKPVRGSEQFVEEWNGARWLFSTIENRDRFRNAPDKYAPQFGGYCAYAVSHNYTAKTDPEAWTIVDGRLYLNFDLDTQKEWLAQRDQFIADGHQNWPKVLW